MTILLVFFIALFLLVGLLLCFAYRETEQDFPPVHRSRRS